MSDDFLPNWASPPGETIKEILEEKMVSHDTFLQSLSLIPNRASYQWLEMLFAGKIEIDKTLASMLFLSLGVSEEFWLNRELNYRKTLKRLESEKTSCVLH